jgi:ketosteroid isomerase-like protein
METEGHGSGPHGVVDRLARATNDHDLDAIVACFEPEYRNETPAHPERAFTGKDQVRRNWEQILDFVPDITAEIIRSAVDGSTVWSEWEMRGTRRDGSAHLMRGVMIIGVAGDLVSWMRFYMEPVEVDTGDVDAAVSRQVRR